MPTPTYTALANTTLSGPSSIVSFSSIPSSYRDLIMVATITYAGTPGDVILRVNNDSSALYDSIWALGDGTTTYGGGQFSQSSINPILSGNDGKSILTWQLLDYSTTDRHKTTLIRSGGGAGRIVMAAGRWANTAAVNSITIRDTASNTFATGSTFALYGVIA